MTRPRRYDLIAFDWDGTLFDSTALIVRCIQAACRDLGVAVPDDQRAAYEAEYAFHPLHIHLAVLAGRIIDIIIDRQFGTRRQGKRRAIKEDQLRFRSSARFKDVIEEHGITRLYRDGLAIAQGRDFAARCANNANFFVRKRAGANCQGCQSSEEICDAAHKCLPILLFYWFLELCEIMVCFLFLLCRCRRILVHLREVVARHVFRIQQEIKNTDFQAHMGQFRVIHQETF